MAISTRAQILKILDHEELVKEFGAFSDQLDTDLASLQQALSKMPLSNEVPKLETHMTFVESWRERVARRLSFVICFLQHAKSHHFLIQKTKFVTADDRTAFQKSLTAGMESWSVYLEHLIDCIDSRVNEVKKLIGVESEVGGRRLHG
jgi:hypothetical protein